MHKILDSFSQIFVFIASLKSHMCGSPTHPRVAERPRALLPRGTSRPRVGWTEPFTPSLPRDTACWGSMCYEQEASPGFTVTNASHLVTLLLARVCPPHHRLVLADWSWTQKDPWCLSLWGMWEKWRGVQRVTSRAELRNTAASKEAAGGSCKNTGQGA